MINFLALVIFINAIIWTNNVWANAWQTSDNVKPAPKQTPGQQTVLHAASPKPKVTSSKSTAPSSPPNTPDGQTISSVASWRQDFSAIPNGPIDLGIWNILEGNNDGWGNHEAQTYTKDNVGVQNGALVITAQKSGSSYTSARITTQNKFDFMYGKLDIVAEIPTGRGVWPAIWLLPSDAKYAEQGGADTAWLSNGEIDMVEGSSQGDNVLSGSAHSLNHYPGNNMRSGSVQINSPSATFHTYTLEWTPQSLDYLVDGKAFHHVANSGAGFKDWPYDQRFHLVMNVAIGGDESSLAIDDSALPAQLKVRSITYYPYGK